MFPYLFVRKFALDVWEVTDYYQLILYPATLLKIILIISIGFLLEIFESLQTIFPTGG